MLSRCGAIVQRHDPDRFVTALFAPPPAREVLFTLYAFNHELARAREVASAPVLALIRLQWWREVVEGADRAHEVATPLREALRSGRLDPSLLIAMIEARMMEAEDGLDQSEWFAYLHGASGALMVQAGQVLDARADRDALERLGAGCGATGLLRNHHAHRAAGRWSFPHGRDQDWCAAEARLLLAEPRAWPKPLVPAVLPAIFARRWLRRGAGPDPWSRLAVWTAARRGRV